ncbi:hypothetical protein RF11_02657 [Thelohanellus kitauei]|uniref:Uncharacterized protein n=1 Tax=Thelohanellus kitauei TaxID=669202 RepID=A0A0C2ND06_THEKT|nr:hypothetical protein RF11_02657 [Thelohanellus kitauei]
MLRLNIFSTESTIKDFDYLALAEDQRTDNWISSLSKSSACIKVKETDFGNPTIKLLFKISNEDTRPLITAILCKHIFNVKHSLSHPSVRSTRKMIHRHSFWRHEETDLRMGTCLHSSPKIQNLQTLKAPL